MPEICECKHEAKIAMLEQRDGMILDLLGKLEQKTDLILMQITKVAVLEVNHSHQSEALSRAFSRIEAIESTMKEQAKYQKDAIDTLSKDTMAFINEMNGMGRMAKLMWGILTGVVALLGVKVVFGGS